MAQVSELTLRLDILREALERYRMNQGMANATEAERSLYGLKIAECEAMLNELMGTSEEEAP